MKFSASKVLLLLIVINFFNYVDRYVLSAVRATLFDIGGKIEIKWREPRQGGHRKIAFVIEIPIENKTTRIPFLYDEAVETKLSGKS